MENRTFIPGSEWVYLKLYSGTNTADAILKKELYGYVNEMMKNEIIDKWFFTRYGDPDFHIRLRLHLKETRNFTSIFNCFFDTFLPLVDNMLVWKIQCDTYQREIERYGSNTISLVEELFFIDSYFVIKLLNQFNEEKNEQYRWKFALILIDSFFNAFSFDLLQCKELSNTLSENFKNEFGFTHHNAKIQLDEKFRTYRKDIENAMLWINEDSENIEIIKDRKKFFFPTVEKLLKMNKADELQVSLNALLTSVIHMTMNRWFRSKNKLHEMVIYDFLSRYYTSETMKKLKKFESK
jgi:thiopeptide-type bacteriocin biosynthesis protein